MIAVAQHDDLDRIEILSHQIVGCSKGLYAAVPYPLPPGDALDERRLRIPAGPNARQVGRRIEDGVGRSEEKLESLGDESWPLRENRIDRIVGVLERVELVRALQLQSNLRRDALAPEAIRGERRRSRWSRRILRGLSRARSGRLRSSRCRSSRRSSACGARTAACRSSRWTAGRCLGPGRRGRACLPSCLGARRLPLLLTRRLLLRGAGRIPPLVAGDVENAVVAGGVVEVVRLGDQVMPRVHADLLDVDHCPWPDPRGPLPLDLT